jgi:nicotinamidase-related amidase
MNIFKQKWIFTLLVFVTFVCFAGDPRIGNNYALIIIDMQPTFITRGGDDKDPKNIKKVAEIIAHQKELIALAKKQNMPIVFLEYESMGPTNSELKKETEGYANTKYFTKDSDGMFDSYNSHEKELSDYLRSKEVGNLIITGANGGACVSESISGSLANNYNVLAYTYGIADFNYKDFIYPYVKHYDFKPTCPSCTFREINEYETISLEVATNGDKAPKLELGINDSDRYKMKDMKPLPSLKPKTKVNAVLQ